MAVVSGAGLGQLLVGRAATSTAGAPDGGVTLSVGSVVAIVLGTILFAENVVLLYLNRKGRGAGKRAAGW
jgi:hypothetical protein